MISLCFKAGLHRTRLPDAAAAAAAAASAMALPSKRHKIIISSYYSFSLWMKGMAFERPQRGYLRPEAATVHYDQRLQQLTDHRKVICNQRSPGFWK